MSEMKDTLIRLGAENPDLRQDIKPVLAHLEKQADAFAKIRALGSDLRRGGEVFVQAVMSQDQDDMRRWAYKMCYAMGVMFSALGMSDEARLLKGVAQKLR